MTRGRTGAQQASEGGAGGVYAGRSVKRSPELESGLTGDGLASTISRLAMFREFEGLVRCG